MTQRTCWSAIVLALSIGWSLPLAAEEPIDWVRQAVLFKTPEVRLREKPDDQALVIEKPTTALWFYVLEAQDGWLRVDGGWVRHDDVVRKAEAVEHFTSEIQRGPSAFAYACRSRAWTDAKEFDKALADADAAVKINATYAPAFFARARAWEGKEDFAHALDDLNECLRIDSTNSVAYEARSGIHARRGDHEQAIRELDEAVKLRPRDADLLRCRADAWSAKGNFERAFADYDDTLKIDPRNVPALFGRARVWWVRRELEKAIADLNAAIAFEPNAVNAIVYEMRGGCQTTLGRTDLALADYSEAIRLDPKLHRMFLRRAWVWYVKHDLDKALSDLDEALRLKPDLAEAYADRCGIWVKKKDWGKALADADEAVRLAPTLPRAFTNRSAAKMEMGDSDGALADATEAIRLDPKDATAYNNRGYVRLKKRDIDLALADFDQSLRLDPNSELPHLNRGRVWMAKKELKRSIADFDEAVRLNPNQPEYRCERAWCWVALGQHDKAIADADDALRLDPKLVAAYNVRSSAWISQGKYDLAITDAEAALRLDPQNARAFSDRGAAYLGKGAFEQAISDCTESIRLNQTLDMSYNNRGAAYLGKGDLANAHRDLDRAIELTSDNAIAYKNRAEMWARQNNNEAAIADLGEYLKLRPDDAAGYAKRARLWLKQGELDEAVADFAESLRLDPNQPGCLVERGGVKIDQGAIDEGIDDCTAALELNEKYVFAYRNRAWGWGKKKDWNNAIDDCNTALRYGENNAWTHYYRGFAYLHKEQLDAALEDLNEAIRLDPKLADAYTRRALVHEKKGNLAESQHDRAEAGKLNGTQAVGTYGAGEALYQPQSDVQELLQLREALRRTTELDRGEALNALAWKLATCPNEHCRNGKEAVELAQQAVASMPGNWYVLDTLAAAHAENGDFAEAVKCQEQALQMWQRLPADGTQRFEEPGEGLGERLSLYQAGKPYREPQAARAAYTPPITLPSGNLDLLKQGMKQLNQGHLDEAVEAFNTVIERDPKQTKAYFWRSHYKNQLNQFDEALADLNEAIRLDPKFLEAFRERAWTWQRLGKFAEGLADLNEALRIAPKNELYLLDRGRFQILLGDYVAALADFDRALGLTSNGMDVIAIQVERAKLLAGCPDDMLRNGKLALESAEAAQAASRFPRASCAEALAAAYAECGSFAEAVEWQTKAVELSQRSPDQGVRKSQLELYRAGKPYRLPVPAQAKAAEATAADANGDEAHASAKAVVIELNDVPADAVLVFAVRPSEIAQCNGTGALIAAINTHFNLKDHTVADLVEIKAAFTDFGTGDRQPQGHAIFRSKAALDWNKFTLDLFGPAKGSAIRKGEHAGKTYFVVNPRAAYYLADERTMVTASESKIEEVIEELSSPQAKITWANRWRRIAGGQLALMVDLEGIDKWIGRDLHSLPPDRQALIGTISPLWEHGQQLFLGLHAEDGLAVDAQFYCDGVDSAERVRASLNASLTLAGNLLDKQSEDSGEIKDDANPMLIVADLVRALLKKAELTCDDKIVQWRSHVKFDRLTDSKSTSGESGK